MMPCSGPAVLNVANLRDLNSYEVVGLHRRNAALDDLILTHLTLLAELRKLNAYEELVCRWLAEGYNESEIAAECGVSRRTVGRWVLQIGWTLYGIDASDALAKEDTYA